MRRRMALALSALIAVVVLGTVGYVVVEGWRVFDALYMTVITVGTVGYSEVGELSDPGRAFTMGLIILGFGVLLFALGTFIDFVVEGHLKGILEGRRMMTKIESLNGHHIVAGIGRVGSVVARALAEEGVPFLVVESDPESGERARSEGWLVLDADATDEETLLAAGITRAKGLVTALDSDADNLFVTFSARSLNPDLFIVARSSHETSEAKLLRAGADRVLTPNVIGGRRMAAMLMQPVVSDFLDLVFHGDGVEFRLQEVQLRPESSFVGMTIKDAQVRESTGAYILAIQQHGGAVNTNPSPDTALEARDRLVVLGTTAQIDALMQVL